MSSPLESAAETLKASITVKADEIKKNPALAELVKEIAGLNALEQVMGKPQTPLSAFLGLEIQSNGSASSGVSVKFDEFFGMDQLDAAKAYLRKTKEARPFNEIITKIVEGGGKVPSESKLQISLSRSTLDVVKIGGDRYGLREHYPNAKLKKRAPGVDAVVDDPEAAEPKIEEEKMEGEEEVKP